MESSQEHIDPEQRYPIGEAARLVGKDRKTILTYSKMRPPILDFIESSINGRKLFLGKDLIRLKLGYL